MSKANLIPVKMRDKDGRVATRWVRPKGVDPPSQSNSHRRKHFTKIRLKAIAAFGSKCVECGYADSRALQIDHIKGDGWKRKKNQPTVTGTSYYYAILKNPDPAVYQILCANCNTIKRLENSECGHELDKT